MVIIISFITKGSSIRFISPLRIIIRAVSVV
jgi:hypothetical protein